MTSITDLSAISKEDMAAALKIFLAFEADLSPSCCKKFLKMEFQVLAYIVSKAILIKAGIFYKITK